MSNTLNTNNEEVGKVSITQTTDYPGDGVVKLTIKEFPRKSTNLPFTINVRVPQWCDNVALTVNGQPIKGEWLPNTYASINRKWKKGDEIVWVMDMPVKLLEANPLAEEIRNQVVVKRGPLVYCLESMDIADNKCIDDVLIPDNIQLIPQKIEIEGSPIVALDGVARLANNDSWSGVLYREVSKADKDVHIRLIPYYAWGNRGKAEMTVWMPLSR